MKLGRKLPIYDGRALHLAKYMVAGQLPSPPLMVDWTSKITVPWGAMLNDKLGDCTCAALGHIAMAVTAYGDGILVVPPDAEIETMYEKIGHYVPGDDSTDNGATEQSAMAYMRKTGLAGVKADAYADINVANLRELLQSIALFGPTYIGVWLSQTDIDNFQAGKGWTDLSDTNSIGGHAVPIVGYDRTAVEVLTWGRKQPTSYEWLKAHMDEAHAMLFFDWINKKGLAPSGFNLGTLQRDLSLVTA